MADQQIETLGFQSEVKQLLHLMIHSLYSNREIFLRELISNASDAIDKLRFLALKDDSLAADRDYKIRIAADKDNSTLTISDNGIGMTREQVKNNLGTIAKSGTKEFLNAMTQDESKGSSLIGQFGVGFYSAFIVADQVDVYTLAADGSDTAVKWSSKGEGEYTLAAAEKATNGTDIVLHIKEEHKEFLEEWKLKEIITKYSDHISIDVELQTAIRDEEGKETGSTKWDKVNQSKALWTLPKGDITDEQYKEFYKSLTGDYQEPMTWAHNHVEGNLEYTSLLYLPSKAPWDLNNREQVHGLKLYIQRVFIMENSDAFLPNYLRFIKGLVDANNLPLNVSREILQDSKVTAALKKALTKRALDMLKKLAKNKEDYQKVWNEFGNTLKEGLATDYGNQKTLGSLLRFSSTHTNSVLQDVSLDEYIERMIEGQKDIYYIAADSHAAAKNNPHLEVFKKKGIEVLLLSDNIDEWMMGYFTEYNDKKIQNIAKSDIDLGDLADEEKSIEEDTTQHQDKLDLIKTHLAGKIKEVKFTAKLTESPAIVSTADDQLSTQMAKLFQSAGQAVPAIQYTFEINPHHPLVEKMLGATGDSFNTWVDFLFEQALLAEKGSLDDPSAFVKVINDLLTNQQ